jgi:hypothetical protein
MERLENMINRLLGISNEAILHALASLPGSQPLTPLDASIISQSPNPLAGLSTNQHNSLTPAPLFTAQEEAAMPNTWIKPLGGKQGASGGSGRQKATKGRGETRSRFGRAGHGGRGGRGNASNRPPDPGNTPRNITRSVCKRVAVSQDTTDPKRTNQRTSPELPAPRSSNSSRASPMLLTNTPSQASTVATSQEELFLDNGDGSLFSVGYAKPRPFHPIFGNSLEDSRMVNVGTPNVIRGPRGGRGGPSSAKKYAGGRRIAPAEPTPALDPT